MSKFTFFSVLVFCGSVVFADDPAGPSIGSAWMMSDGSKVYPTNSAATPSQIQSLQTAQDALSSQVEVVYSVSTGAVARANEALEVVEFINQDDIVVSQVFVNSVGAPAAAGTNQVINILGLSLSGYPLTNISVVVEFDQLQTTSPGLDWRTTLSESGNSGSTWLAVTNSTCSWPSTVSHPSAVYPFIYRFNVPVVGAPASLFVRAISHDDGGAGSGFYFIIYNGLIINGRMGRTATIIDDAGGTNEFVTGLLVRPLEETL